MLCRETSGGNMPSGLTGFGGKLLDESLSMGRLVAVSCLRIQPKSRILPGYFFKLVSILRRAFLFRIKSVSVNR